MSTSPIEPSKFHLVIRELAKVRTQGGLAALTLGLLFLSLVFVLFLTTDIDRMILTMSILAGFLGFAVFAFLKLKQERIQNEDNENVNKRKQKTK